MTARIDAGSLTDEALLADACQRLGVRMLVLFGSYATLSPPPAPDSDVDLAISLHGGGQRHGFEDFQRELGPAFGTRSLDLAFLRDADPLFRWEIMSRGKQLWGDPLEFLEYRAFAFRDFTDSADLRRLERCLFDKKMALIRERLRAAS